MGTSYKSSSNFVSHEVRLLLNCRVGMRLAWWGNNTRAHCQIARLPVIRAASPQALLAGYPGLQPFFADGSRHRANLHSLQEIWSTINLVEVIVRCITIRPSICGISQEQILLGCSPKNEASLSKRDRGIVGRQDCLAAVQQL